MRVVYVEPGKDVLQVARELKRRRSAAPRWVHVVKENWYLFAGIAFFAFLILKPQLAKLTANQGDAARLTAPTPPLAAQTAAPQSTPEPLGCWSSKMGGDVRHGGDMWPPGWICWNGSTIRAEDAPTPLP